MINYKTKYLTFVVYDGIRNSVFQSQVLQPILRECKEDKNLNVRIICFEKKIPSKSEIESIFLGKSKRIECVFYRRMPFFGLFSLILARFYFKRFLKENLCDQIIARGALAGYIAIKSLSRVSREDIPLLIQARGLCAQEYRYTVQKSKYDNFIKNIWSRFIFRSLNKIECKVYSLKDRNIRFEVVSPALRDYLIKNFSIEPTKVTVAVRDLPSCVDNYWRVIWRKQVRDKFKITYDMVVYCYNGSFRPWQCVKETMEFLYFEFLRNPEVFIMILTQDVKLFEKELAKLKIPTQSCRVLSVNLNELYKYLCAADFGVLLREPDIINWVSRPTKMLDYQACGLKIIHNNTVAWLANSENNSEPKCCFDYNLKLKCFTNN